MFSRPRRLRRHGRLLTDYGTGGLALLLAGLAGLLALTARAKGLL